MNGKRAEDPHSTHDSLPFPQSVYLSFLIISPSYLSLLLISFFFSSFPITHLQNPIWYRSITVSLFDSSFQI
ncbi:unnamed protein product [Citrullus colocynthis]|uniref:Transmembrane protein n=1 Tax=Citrullus colocynthis TaxID=252529 RepID=A0ABP0XMG6_9ROSI